ncbi:chaperone modulator CbpM [Pelagibius sp. CAU 1746]|uniref:chaperone modulator CbpM n=1 Tax=Pelagibius sp. CAU 1746 TaxID=3140370 RepID=UPI00325B30AC
MLVKFDEVLVSVDIGASELHAWIEQNWVLPVEEGGDYFFDDTDVARVRLIAELRNDLGVNEDAIPVVLRLLDQVYSLRRALADLNEAIQELPESAQEQLRSYLSDNEDDGERTAH